MLSATDIATVVGMIHAGTFDWVAARALHVTPKTFYEWMKRGRDGDPLYADFAEQVDTARANARAVREIAIAKKDPRTWLMQGPGRDRVGEPGWTSGAVQVTGVGGGPLLTQDRTSAALLQRLDKMAERKALAEQRRAGREAAP